MSAVEYLSVLLYDTPELEMIGAEPVANDLAAAVERDKRPEAMQ